MKRWIGTALVVVLLGSDVGAALGWCADSDVDNRGVIVHEKR